MTGSHITGSMEQVQVQVQAILARSLPVIWIIGHVHSGARPAKSLGESRLFAPSGRVRPAPGLAARLVQRARFITCARA